MGCDGGTIPKRHELIRVKAKEEVKDSYSQTITKWFYCQLSNSLLEEPIVSDQLGRLYNKEFIVRKLLEKVDKSELNDIYTIKQLTNLNLTKCLNENDDTKDAIQDDIKQFKFLPRFMCPITRKEMNVN
ncbi:Protein RTF2 [Clydaea vesicula]|uniref:Protein RTF2 n=1 Tax=Clydaea vesicula TaxID=447962 RepID=A0AAD5U2Q0_9FUNG|nr:Protein RTF2 [Clydaea vesicula]